MMLRSAIGSQTALILIVDDERKNRNLLQVMLEPEGFLFSSAASAEEALVAVAQQRPDLILMDVMMPGMDGFQLASAIKRDVATRSIPIIMVTALDDRDARMRGFRAGAEDFLTKPVDPAELCVRVRNLLRLKAYGEYYDKYSQMLESEMASRTAELLERTKQAAILTEQAALLDLAQDTIVVWDMDSRVLFWSHGAELMYGWLSSEAMGRNTRYLLRTECSEATEDIETRLMREGQWEGQVTHHKRDGTSLTVDSRWALQRDADGAAVRVLSIDNVVTGRKRVDSERLLLTERLWLATAAAKVGLWDWDLVGDTRTWDATLCEIYGFAPVVQMPFERWAAAVHPEDLPAVEARLRKIVEDKGQGAGEYRIILADDSVRNISSVERTVLDDRGQVSRLIGVNMDVTQRKKAEKAVEQSRRDQTRFKDDFLSHVSHELRSPLTAIKQFTTILLDGLAGELNSEQRQYQQIVVKNVRQLESMIDDLFEVTRLESGKLTIELESASAPTAVTDAINTLQLTATAKGIVLSYDLPPDLPRAYADQTRLRQILIILLDNAVKFTPEGGAVSVRVRPLADDPKFLLFEVSDTGSGISPEIAGRLFERLYQDSETVETSRKGLGLGLYICRELVTRQSGQIWAKRRAEKGSVFSFTLPVFSLSDLVVPLLKNGKWPTESAALVLVQTSAPSARPSKESEEEWSHAARGLLQRCMLPNLDVLLPNMGTDVAGERFLVAAFADEKGAAVLANRIREQFERLPQLRHTGRTLSVSYTMLQPFPHEIGASTTNIVTKMTTSLEESIKFRTSAEASTRA